MILAECFSLHALLSIKITLKRLVITVLDKTRINAVIRMITPMITQNVRISNLAKT
jgi:hypothetical protein